MLLNNWREKAKNCAKDYKVSCLSNSSREGQVGGQPETSLSPSFCHLVYPDPDSRRGRFGSGGSALLKDG